MSSYYVKLDDKKWIFTSLFRIQKLSKMIYNNKSKIIIKRACSKEVSGKSGQSTFIFLVSDGAIYSNNMTRKRKSL